MSDAHLEISELTRLWARQDAMTFDSWVKAVTDMVGDLTIERAAKLIGTNPAEVEAVTRLSMLSDEDLCLVAEYRPPKTTWFLLTNLRPEDIKSALEAIKACPSGEPPSSVLNTHADIIKSQSIEQEVAHLQPEVFYFLAKRAKTYGVLNDTEKRAMFSFGRRREKGDQLTEKQAAWALTMIQEMHTRDVLRSIPGDENTDIILLLSGLLA